MNDFFKFHLSYTQPIQTIKNSENFNCNSEDNNSKLTKIGKNNWKKNVFLLKRLELSNFFIFTKIYIKSIYNRKKEKI